MPGTSEQELGRATHHIRETTHKKAKGRHAKALLWVAPLGSEVVSYMIETPGRTPPYALRPQDWLDDGWRVASWFANPVTGNLQITLIKHLPPEEKVEDSAP